MKKFLSLIGAVIFCMTAVLFSSCDKLSGDNWADIITGIIGGAVEVIKVCKNSDGTCQSGGDKIYYINNEDECKSAADDYGYSGYCWDSRTSTCYGYN